MSQLSIMIPSFLQSPPNSPSGQFESPDWFRPVGKTYNAPTGNITLNSPPLTPPSPISTDSSSEDGDADPPRRPRLPHQTHRRSSAPTYFTDASSFDTLPKRPQQLHRARFPSLPVTGTITPMWNIDEESSGSDGSDDDEVTTPHDEEIRTPFSDESLDPFKMLLPFCKTAVRIPTYTLNEKHFVLTHIPAKRLAISAFKPRLPRVPRWQRPILMAVLCIMLFGGLCVASWSQQAALNAQRASVVRQTVWLAKASAELQSKVDLEPGFKPAIPSHHSLKVQGRLRPRGDIPAAVDIHMTKDEELAALMSLITGTTANALPPFNPSEPIEPELLLPFDPQSPNAKAELEELVQTQWENFPIMIVGKLRDPKMHNLRRVLKTYNVKPEPVFIDFDQRADSEALEPTLIRLLGSQNEPYILLKGVSLDAKIVASLELDEKVVETFSKTGASVAKKLKKNKHQKEEERREMDRVLGPAPILDE